MAQIYSSLQQVLRQLLYAWCVAVNHFSKGIYYIYLSANILIQYRSLLYQYINNTFLYNARGERNDANIFEFTVSFYENYMLGMLL